MNEYLIIGIIAIVTIVVISILYSLGKIKKENILDWLLWAVSEAERLLGGGTGELKRVMAYNLFIGKYPIISNFISKDTFSAWIDIALIELEKLLENQKVSNYINNIDNKTD